MNTTQKFPLPPWDMDNAAEKLQLLENAWNTNDPEKVAEFYTETAEIRFGTALITGREAFKQFLTDKWSKQPGYQIKLDLWGALKGRMAVRFTYEWIDGNALIKGYGVTVFQFDENGYVEMNFASYNEVAA